MFFNHRFLFDTNFDKKPIKKSSKICRASHTATSIAAPTSVLRCSRAHLFLKRAVSQSLLVPTNLDSHAPHLIRDVSVDHRSNEMFFDRNHDESNANLRRANLTIETPQRCPSSGFRPQHQLRRQPPSCVEPLWGEQSN